MKDPTKNNTPTEHLQRSVVTILLRVLAAIFMLDVVYGLLMISTTGTCPTFTCYFLAT
jgi:hypothetical protein